MGVKPKPVFTGSIRPGDADAWVADTPRLRALGWEPRTPLLEGLRRTADWALTHAPTSA
jgi:nucleoside-diphosphate-sugar epimerase